MSDLKIPITVIVIAKNEETNIGRCLEALAKCDELIVIDDNSTDQTQVIASSLSARVVQHAFESFAAQRNWAIECAGCKHDWVLMLDADEVATPEFLAEIDEFIRRSTDDVVAAKICRRTYFDGVWLRFADGYPVWIMRLIRVGRARFYDSGHGEVAVPQVSGTMATIRTPMLHYPFSHGLVSWLQRHVKYANREALLETQSKDKTKLSQILSFQPSARRQSLRALSRRMPFRGFIRFVYQYFLKLGFLDGRAGYNYCRLMALYERMIVIFRDDAKLGDG